MRKALVLFGSEIERETLIDTAIYLKRTLGFKLEALYVRDVERERVLSTPDGLVMAGRVPLMLQGWNAVEQAEIENIKKCFKEKGLEEELNLDIGHIADVVTEHMKTSDILVLGKNDILNDKIIAILKANYKSMLIVGEKPLTAMENIYLGNDNGVKISRSIYHFIHLFPDVKEFHSITINKEIDKNKVVEYLEQNDKKVEICDLTSDDYKVILETVNKADLFIMGNMSRSYFLEKIIGKNGVKLLEKSKAPIFIG